MRLGDRLGGAAAVLLFVLGSPLVSEGQGAAQVQKLAEGVWAAPTENGANVGWFLLGDGVMVVDSGRDESAARWILRQVAATANKPVRYVVLTHAHGDHAGGAKTFAEAGAQVICQENSAPAVLFQPAAGPGTPTPASAARNVVLAVADRVMFVGPQRAEIYWLGSAHTRGDLIVLLPQHKILFAGDLASNGMLPFMRSQDVDPRGWEQVLLRISAAPAQIMVPGHGAIGPTAGIADTLAYVRRVNALANQFIQARAPEDFLHVELRKPENRIENVAVSEDHVSNVKAVMQKERERLEKPTPSPSPATRRTPSPKGS
jgi:cyclase